jgi:hypothetical protein
MQVAPADLQPITFASHTYDTFHLLMPLFGEPRSSSKQTCSVMLGTTAVNQ